MSANVQLFTNLAVAYRGKREYIHGTDIFPILQNCLAQTGISQVKKLELKFSAPITGGFDVAISNEQTTAYKTSQAKMSIHDGQQGHFVYVEPNQVKCSRSNNSNERDLADQLQKSGSHYSISDQSAFTTIEKIVFINKHMLLQEISESSDWFFGRLRLQNFNFAKLYDVNLEIEARTGTGLVSSCIYLNSEASGDVVFLPK